MSKRSLKIGLGALVLGVVAMGWSATAQAAVTLSAAGRDIGNNNWVDAGYGDLGSYFFDGHTGAASGGTPPAAWIRSDLPGYVTSVTPPNHSDYGAQGGSLFTGDSTNAVALQDPSGTGTFYPDLYFALTSLPNDNQYPLVTITFNNDNNDLPDSIRVGILIGARRSLQVPSVGVASSGATPAIQTATAFIPKVGNDPQVPRADWYFFDIHGLTDGTSIQLTSNKSATSGNNIKYEGFVLGNVPEPASAALLLGGGLLLLVRRDRSC